MKLINHLIIYPSTFPTVPCQYTPPCVCEYCLSYKFASHHPTAETVCAEVVRTFSDTVLLFFVILCDSCPFACIIQFVLYLYWYGSQIICVPRQFCPNSALMWTDLVYFRFAPSSPVSLLINRLISRFISMFTRKTHYNKETFGFLLSFKFFFLFTFLHLLHCHIFNKGNTCSYSVNRYKKSLKNIYLHTRNAK